MLRLFNGHRLNLFSGAAEETVTKLNIIIRKDAALKYAV